MNETEKAIRAITAALDAEPDYVFCGESFHLIIDRATQTALAALREQAERSKGCVWCKSDSQVTHNGEHFCFFCSYCGKRLEVEP